MTAAAARPGGLDVAIGDWALLVLAPAAALLARNRLPAWFFMWALAFTVYAGCKWLTWRRARRKSSRAPRFAALKYLAGWVGMDAASFLARSPSGTNPARVTRQEWAAAAAKTIAGVALILTASWLAQGPDSPAAAWLGMTGAILVLHFGTFQLLALIWRSRGVDVQPLMRRPLLSTSLAEFWGRRWNAAFNGLARDVAFRPLARRFGVTTAAMGVFVFSGLLHDAVISLPARGGYGLPTAYFLLQGGATLFERSAKGRAFGLGTGWRGRIFTVVVTAGPAYWLFHPAFVRNVILPMLRVI